MSFTSIDLQAARDIVHNELDGALDELLLKLLGEPPATEPVTIALVITPSWLRQVAGMLP